MERQNASGDSGKLFLEVLKLMNDGQPFASDEYFQREFKPDPPLSAGVTIRDVLNSRPHTIQFWRAQIAATHKYRADLARGLVSAEAEALQ